MFNYMYSVAVVSNNLLEQNLGTSQYSSFYSFVGQTCKFVVNTCNAGAGALAVTVEGPSKVKLECKEVDEGYEFTYSPTAPGDYMITIRYAGVNIAGSPFKAKIEGIHLQTLYDGVSFHGFNENQVQ